MRWDWFFLHIFSQKIEAEEQASIFLRGNGIIYCCKLPAYMCTTADDSIEVWRLTTYLAALTGSVFTACPRIVTPTTLHTAVRHLQPYLSVHSRQHLFCRGNHFIWRGGMLYSNRDRGRLVRNAADGVPLRRAYCSAVPWFVVRFVFRFVMALFFGSCDGSRTIATTRVVILPDFCFTDFDDAV